MKKADFIAKNFFDLNNVYVKAFLETTPLWEIITKLPAFLDSLFKEGRLKGNLSQNVFVEKDASIDKTARIIGPAYIGKGVKIGFNAYVRENVILEENSIVGHASEVKNSIILKNSSLAHFNYISESIIGNNVRVGAGAKFANRRLDRQNIILNFDDGRLDSNTSRFGAIVGDEVKIGVNSVFNPGTIVGKNSVVHPLTIATGIYPENSIIK